MSIAKIMLMITVVFTFSASACATGDGGSVTGLLYKNSASPYQVLHNKIGSRRGEATAISILGLVGIGDASIRVAARNGRITKIATVDQYATNYLGIYATSTTIVTGE